MSQQARQRRPGSDEEALACFRRNSCAFGEHRSLRTAATTNSTSLDIGRS